MIGKLINLCKITDPRGNLTVAEQYKDIGPMMFLVANIVEDTHTKSSINWLLPQAAVLLLLLITEKKKKAIC